MIRFDIKSNNSMSAHFNTKLFCVFRLKLVLISLIFCLVNTNGKAQNSHLSLQQIVEVISKRSLTLPLEKVYLQLDKPYYTAGEDVWFKGYVILGALHRPSAKSGILNVELINNENETIRSVKLKIDNGLCKGDFALPDTLKAGNYQVRAFTRYMQNFSPDNFYAKNIYIGNAITNDAISKAVCTQTDLAGSKNLSIRIKYLNVNGQPFSLKKVTYIVTTGGRQRKTGTLITDVNGNSTFDFTPTDTLPVNIRSVLQTSNHISITNTVVNYVQQAIKVQFFPEGGYMVNGLESTVGIKSIDPNGLGKNVEGVIKDSEKKDVVSFKTTHLGMGSSKFTPQSGQVYRAVVKDAAGNLTTINLPVPHNNGFVLSVDNSDTVNVNLVIKSTKLDSGSTLGLTATSNGVICYATLIRMLVRKPVTIKIPKSRFPSGVAQFTLFSPQGEPVNERIAFIMHRQDLMNINLNTDKVMYKPQEKVSITLAGTDYDNLPVSGSFSALVVNESLINYNEDNEHSILSALLLTSDLKGYIEQPGYYFNSKNNTTTDLDRLMLTQGYRSIGWKKILEENSSQYIYHPEKEINISGMLETPKGSPLPHTKIRLITTTGPPKLLDTLSDNEGRFVFKGSKLKDSTRFVLQAVDLKGRDKVVIELDTLQRFNIGNTIITDTADVIPLAYLQNSKRQYEQDLKYGNGNHGIVLKEINIQSIRPELKHSANLNGPGVATQIISGNVFRNRACATVADCLAGILKGVIIDVNGIPFMPRNDNSLSSSNNMLVIVDGAEIIGSSTDSPLNYVNPQDVASIEMITDPGDLAIYGTRGRNGIILINTRQGDEPGFEAPKAINILSSRFKGYYIARDFYSPDYVVDKSSRPDLRTTIFWKPDIITSKDGSANFSYCNGDAKGVYRILVEGIDNNGKIGRQVLRYKVE